MQRTEAYKDIGNNMSSCVNHLRQVLTLVVPLLTIEDQSL